MRNTAIDHHEMSLAVGRNKKCTLRNLEGGGEERAGLGVELRGLAEAAG